MKQPKKMTHLLAEQTESGRSMVEMLGVLAIMGILSIGGIAGYTYAMNKLRANNTITYVNMLAIAGSQQAALGRDELTLGEFPAKTTDGYDADIYRLADEPRYFDIDIAGVPRAVCTNILALTTHWRGLDSVWVNDNQTTCEQDENLMSFIFSETLGTDENGGSRCTQDSECSGCQRCVRGFCTDTDAACSGDTPYCVNGTCQGCHAGEFQDTKGKCYPCSGDNVVEHVDQSECYKCKGQRFYYALYQRCVPCSNDANTWQYYADSTSCQACGNRYYRPSGEEGRGTCPYCDGNIVLDDSGQQLCQRPCPAGQVWNGSKCVACDDSVPFWSHTYAQSCLEQCAGIRIPQSAACVRCDNLNHIVATKEVCETCPKRYADGSLCIYCPTHIVVDANGNRTCPHEACGENEVWSTAGCQPCDTPNDLYDADYNDCMACGNRRYSSRTCILQTGH